MVRNGEERQLVNGGRLTSRTTDDCDSFAKARCCQVVQACWQVMVRGMWVTSIGLSDLQEMKPREITRWRNA